MKKLVILAVLLSLMTTSFSVQAHREALLKSANVAANGAYTRKAFLELNKQAFDVQDSRRKLLIIGDSHAQDFLNAVNENNYLTHYQIRTHYIPTRCQVVFEAQARTHIEAKDRAFCQQANELDLAKPIVAEADVIILVARWRDWSAKLLPSTLQQLAVKPQQKVIVLGTKDFGKVNVRQYLSSTLKELVKLTNKVDPVPIATNDPLSQGAKHYTFVNQQSIICGSTTTCRLFTEQGELISYDGGHLTPAGAKWVGQRLFTNSPLGQL
ncbi:MAG: SGNH hydrolase domain-containing protein [Thiofilum sp.]|uniref:SGNH hydrolase domain-containing protein n=1 Tax=Thiofilum sp. TaxID=2212733 RepID=UPI0025E2DD66|nr:SGNH hydrolase domain-containing protein [Thiofilum sp.]MBK8454777.1 hypothetical protein [Thiofilum sp.]